MTLIKNHFFIPGRFVALTRIIFILSLLPILINSANQPPSGQQDISVDEEPPQNEQVTYKPVPSLEECHSDMMKDWYNVTKYPYIECTPEELEYFKSCSAFEATDDNGDEYYDESEVKPKADETPCLRQECRALSQSEWDTYANSWIQFHNTPISRNSRTSHFAYADQHRFSVSPAAHNGPCFLPWHREFLSRSEMGMKRFGPYCHCYIDTSLDLSLPNSCDSVLWSPDFFGNSIGQVRSGFCGGWQVSGSGGCGGGSLVRNCNPNARSLLYSRNTMNNIIGSYTSYADLCMPDNPDYEIRHGGVHSFIGGNMNSISCAANDPVFFAHHSFIDYLYQRCRDQVQPMSRREQGYPFAPDSRMNADSVADPFGDVTPPVRCRTGLSSMYDTTYRYRSVPDGCNGCNVGRGALWCFNGRCTSKVRINGDCRGLGDEACYQESGCNGRQPFCDNGICRC